MKKIMNLLGVAILVFSLFGIQSVYATITSQLDIGDRGPEVTELQTYLAKNPNLYPSGLVTGYFGSLTQGGVQKFQVAQGIVSGGTPETTGYGRVGPQTMARINSLLGAVGTWYNADAYPILSNLSVQHTGTTATFSFMSNEPTRGQVYWSTMPLVFYEETAPRQQPYISGTLAVDAGGLQNSHTITVSNLQRNTTYYYMVRGIDSVGNSGIIWPSSFRTE